MSLAIDVDTITRVLLTADGWHHVANHSFTLDSYEYVADADNRGDWFTLHGGGTSGVCATGYLFTTPAGVTIAGPLTAILAVENKREVQD